MSLFVQLWRLRNNLSASFIWWRYLTPIMQHRWWSLANTTSNLKYCSFQMHTYITTTNDHFSSSLISWYLLFSYWFDIFGEMQYMLLFILFASSLAMSMLPYYRNEIQIRITCSMNGFGEPQVSQTTKTTTTTATATNSVFVIFSDHSNRRWSFSANSSRSAHRRTRG